MIIHNSFALMFAMFLLALPGMAAGSEAIQAPQEEPSYVGTVKSAEIAGKYVYILLDQDGKEVWLATMPGYFPKELVKGDKVQYRGGDDLSNFQSKTLGKTFDSIKFVSRVRLFKEDPPADKGAIPDDSVHRDLQNNVPHAAAPVKGEIDKIADGKTVAELYGEADALKGTEIKVRARVMKVSTKILGKSWLTLQDGTGSPPDNTLTATTLETATLGDDVIVKGTLKTNVDLGAGYRYKVLIENATILK